MGFALGANGFLSKPVERSPPCGADQPVGRRRAREGPRPDQILLVDDDPAARAGRAAPDRESWVSGPPQAANGRAALEWLRSERPARRHPPRPDHAGDGRVRVPEGASRRRQAGEDAGGGRDREGSDAGGHEHPGQPHTAQVIYKGAASDIELTDAVHRHPGRPAKRGGIGLPAPEDIHEDPSGRRQRNEPRHAFAAAGAHRPHGR